MASLEGVPLSEVESLAMITKTLAENPATRKEMLKLIKTASPMTPIPELEMEMRMQESTQPLAAEVENLKKQLQERDFNQMRSEAHKRLMDKGLDKEDLNKLEALMVEKKIGDFETAGEFYLQQKKAAEPTASNFSGKSTITLPNMKEMGDINQWARGQAFEAINDLMKARR